MAPSRHVQQFQSQLQPMLQHQQAAQLQALFKLQSPLKPKHPDRQLVIIYGKLVQSARAKYLLSNDNPCFEKPNTVCIKTSESHLCECKLGFTKDDQGECSICSTNFVAIGNGLDYIQIKLY